MNVSERDLLLAELRHAHDGDPWHGPSRSRVLADITSEEAARHPGGDAHSIWELALHMRAWTLEVTRRLGGASPRMPAEGDWPAVPSPSDEAWAEARHSLDAAHHALASLLQTFPAERLDDLVGTDRDAPLGAGVTYRAMLHGTAQHDAYHTGQIVILVKLYRGLRRRPGTHA